MVFINILKIFILIAIRKVLTLEVDPFFYCIFLILILDFRRKQENPSFFRVTIRVFIEEESLDVGHFMWYVGLDLFRGST